ncbi:MAG: DUF1835 domain-containing protein [Proteobacteria bacterium]|nr:DUF1835 domain-containing protein [Pseudomonadota bacterium]
MNILNGDSGAGLFKQAFQVSDNDILVFSDVLSCGPLKSFQDTDDWIQYREKYWYEILLDCAIEPYSFRDSPRDFFVNIEELKNANEINLWIGSGLSDQLLLVFIVFIFDLYNLDANKLSVFQFYKLDGLNYEIHGIGLLNPDNIKRHPESIKLNDKMLKTCLNVWNVILDNDPDSLLIYLNRDSTISPLLF